MYLVLQNTTLKFSIPIFREKTFSKKIGIEFFFREIQNLIVFMVFTKSFHICNTNKIWMQKRVSFFLFYKIFCVCANKAVCFGNQCKKSKWFYDSKHFFEFMFFIFFFISWRKKFLYLFIFSLFLFSFFVQFQKKKQDFFFVFPFFWYQKERKYSKNKK